MSDNSCAAAPRSEHRLAPMTWLAVMPTLTALNVAPSGLTQSATVLLRTLASAVTVPKGMHFLMQPLHSKWSPLPGPGSQS